jgi:NAD(P)-dependent dehydrogenase (short-subunit alcohol dehydrogenase family)
MFANALAGRHALVTGATRGIGAAIAAALREAGAAVTLTGRDSEGLAQQTSVLGERAQAIVMDVSDPDAVTRGFERARAGFGPVHILVNNAGAALSAPFHRTDSALWQSMLDVNLTGTYSCCRAALPGMLEAGFGRIVNVASTAGLTGYAYVTAYCAAKHGVIGLTRALALETARSAVTVNAVCPGYTDTGMVREALANIVAKTGKSEAQARAALTERNPQQRLIHPEEVANAVLWLCLPGAEAVTGQSLSVSGGEVM